MYVWSKSAKAANGETERDAKDRKQLRSLWVTGQKGNCSSHFYSRCTGKSISEALIFASTNPQYDNRLFIEL